MSGLLLSLFNALLNMGKLRPIDTQFAQFIAAKSTITQSPEQAEAMGLLAMVVSHELGNGHVCLHIPQGKQNTMWLAEKLMLTPEQLDIWQQSELHLVKPFDWRALLNANAQICSTGTPSKPTPLVFDGERLYLFRYWHYEQAIGQRFADMVSHSLVSHHSQALQEVLDHLFAIDGEQLAKSYQHQLGDSTSAEEQQKWLINQLDIVEPTSLDWQAIHQAIDSANWVSLTSLIPQAVCLNWQKVAAANALNQQFAVISGGPGTGKTTTVVKILAGLVAQAQLSQQTVPNIKLVAPTGKAAARLTESIGGAIVRLDFPTEFKSHIPTEASTLHRLLGSIPNSMEFRHHRKNPLHLDVLVVDEASMIDLPMMYKLLEALPQNARLILLGDKDQLASVEAGAVLADIFSFYQQGYRQQHVQALQQLTQYKAIPYSDVATPMADSLSLLKKSYRFDAHSGIGRIAQAVNQGHWRDYQAINDHDYTDIQRVELNQSSYVALFEQVTAHYSRYFTFINDIPLEQRLTQDVMDSHARQVLHSFGNGRLLCAVREGEFGIIRANQKIEQGLVARKVISRQNNYGRYTKDAHQHIHWYVGRPIMVSRNDYNLGLFNGDIGICLYDQSSDNPRLKVYFEMPDGSMKAILPSRVPTHETAFAMTIHKSQGSEFDTTFILLPTQSSSLITRELVYTGITRAKKHLILVSEEDVMRRAIRNKTYRASGLAIQLANTNRSKNLTS